MGKRVGCFGGNVLGADHTQFGTLPIEGRNELTPDQQTRSPVGLTLDEFMKFCWRVRRWQFTFDISYSYQDSFGDDTFNVTYTKADQRASPPPPFTTQDHFARHHYLLSGNYTVVPDERFLVVSAGIRAPYISKPDTNPVSNRLLGSWFMLDAHFMNPSGNADLHYPSVFYDPEDELFYPNLILQFELNSQDRGANPDVPLFAFTTFQGGISGGPPYPTSNGRGQVLGTLMIFDHEVPIYNVTATDIGGGFGFYDVDAQVEIKPDDDEDGNNFWEFANSEEQPVWNHITGDQLVDPFS